MDLHQEPSGKFLTTARAAEMLGLSPRTLERYRCIGCGPVFHKMGGRVLYRPTDLQQWAGEVACYSTSEVTYEEARRISVRKGRRARP